MTTPADDLLPANESADADDQALFAWLEGVTLGLHDSVPPASLLAKHPNLPNLLKCVRMLDSLAPAERSPPDPVSCPGTITTFPRSFGPYELQQELGRGGMGVVYLARHRVLGSLCALKVIRASEFASSEEIRRFHQEGRAASQVRHPHIISVHDAGDVDGTPYLVMQYVQGMSLAERLKSKWPDLDESVRWLIAVANAVDVLHQNQIVHRDLKPANILLDAHLTPYVTDFGLAKLFELDGERTVSGALIGTPAYMSPEQAWGKQEAVGPLSDVYSLGAILYELLTGKPPFPESNPLDQILRLRDSEPVPLARINPAIPIELQQICQRCLEKQPHDRYPSAAALAADLERYRDGEPIALRPIGYWNAFRRWVRRESPLVSHLAGFLTMAVIVQAADWFAPGHRAPYVPVMSVLVVWTALSVVLQKLLLRGIESAKMIWIPVDAILFTIAVAYAEGPSGSLLVGYSLLIVASAMWYEEAPVILMTIASIATYVALLTVRFDPQPVHYPFIVVGMLAVVGGVVTALVRRIRQLLRIHTIRSDAARN